SERTIDITDVSLVVENKNTGFIFDFELTALNFDQVDEGTALEITGAGAVNGEAFAVSGRYPNDAPFTTTASFASASLT
ncbi:hypothetical protein, partial [Escherichia coli]|uniref:hypothetical protein n=1 Tax=Escherichia coli TaxID=562 RepID=UPI0014123258